MNLVPNPGFENYNTCPYDSIPNLLNLTDYWLDFRESPNYFNSCLPDSINGLWDSPKNGWGYQLPQTGNGYAGLCTYGNPQAAADNFREWIGTELNSPLIIGTKYFISFYFVLARNGFYFSSNWLQII